MHWIEALILGLVQGLTEFLPVSSSGHLELGSALLGTAGKENLLFAVVVHTATVLSTLVVLRKEILRLLTGFFQFKMNSETTYLLKIALSMIPVAIVGLFFKEQVERLFGGGIHITGFMLLLTSCLLFFAWRAKPREKEYISFRDALLIGIAQACAVMPGLSRSGSTIATGLLLGNKKEGVARFSFLMVLVPILGESFLSLADGSFSDAETTLPATTLVVAFLSAFVAGWAACKWMISIVNRGKLHYFAAYCFLIGLLTLAVYYFS